MEPQTIISNIAIGQEDTDRYIVKILYKHDNQWKLRPASLNYKHPSEYVAIELFQDKDALPVYKLFLDIYYDNFSTYRNVYHSFGDVYLQFGNMPFDIQRQLKNHFVLRFVPFGGNFDDFIKPFVEEMRQLK